MNERFTTIRSILCYDLLDCFFNLYTRILREIFTVLVLPLTMDFCVLWNVVVVVKSKPGAYAAFPVDPGRPDGPHVSSP